MRHPTLALALLLFVSAPAAAQRGAPLVVGVADEASGQAIEGAIVAMPDFQRWARTDALGRAAISGVLQGKWTVEVRKFGYQPMTVTLAFGGKDTLDAVLMLTKATTALDTVRVTAEAPVPPRLRPFHQRKAVLVGRFRTRAELVTRWGDRRLAEVVATTFPGLRVEWNGFNAVLSSTRVTHGPGAGRVPLQVQSSKVPSSGVPNPTTGSISCPLRVLVDGMPTADGDVGWVHTSDVAGLEYYAGDTGPPQYRRGSSCGLLMIWLHW